MERLTEIEVAGRKCPLNFSANAVELFENRYGDLSSIEDALEGKTISGQFMEVIWMLSVLIEQGALYKKVIDKEEIDYFTEDELKIVFGLRDTVRIREQLNYAMSVSSETTVETEDDPKNAKTTQDK